MKKPKLRFPRFPRIKLNMARLKSDRRLLKPKPIWLIHGGLVVANVCLGAWFVHQGISHHVFHPTFISYVKGEPWWSAAKFPWQSIVTLLGGFVALGTWWYTRIQAREHFDRTERQQRVHFDRQEIQSQFRDILDRLESDSPLVRSGAANRLAAISQECLPIQDTTVDTYGNQLGSQYPFFSLAAAQLAVALCVEEHQDVRREVLGALSTMSVFVKNIPAPALLREMIDQIADANRVCLDDFTKAIAELEATSKLTIALEYHAPICRDMKKRTECLNSIIGTPQYAEYKITEVFGRDTTANPPDEKEVRARLVAVRQLAYRLSDCRDALATCLHGTRILTLRSGKSDLDGLNLNRCFLATADLGRSFLSSANLMGSHLQYCDLSLSDFTNATVAVAFLQNADLSHCECGEASFTASALENVTFDSSSITGTRLFSSWINKDKRAWPTFAASNWWDADFRDPVADEIDPRMHIALQKLYPRLDVT